MPKDVSIDHKMNTLNKPRHRRMVKVLRWLENRNMKQSTSVHRARDVKWGVLSHCNGVSTYS